MARVHFISAHFGGNPPWKNQIKSSKHDISVAYYDDSNTPSRHLAMHPRLKAKIPKMLEWKFIDSDWYVWMDSSVRLKEEDPVDEILSSAGDSPLCLFKHSYGNSIEYEAKRVLNDLKEKREYISKRYKGEAIKEQLVHYYGDNEFVDNKLFGMTFFAYHRSASSLMQEWFMHNLIWSIEDQISFPYVLFKSGLKYSVFDGTVDGGNKLFKWEWRKREANLGLTYTKSLNNI